MAQEKVLKMHSTCNNTRDNEMKLENIPVVQEFTGVFPESLLELPPHSGTEAISRALYRMAPAKLKELKTQLQELIAKRFIQPSFSHWGTPVLFKKEDVTMRLCMDSR
ncbi:hypothetical protein L3X38_004483 [Prunus dulcis]|uniref:Transposable element protein n=1 Tax=Prunus dulcis TaxID=3755 RepID=A0AAD4ZNW9_PRUDU|nr:hypothetical protein L3X38_004483 [Prunus dulcis]